MKAVVRSEPGLNEAPRPRHHQGLREAPSPVYLHIADTIGERLASGTYTAGSRLPSESQLRQEFGVSHMTVRKALSVLADKGLISTTKGRGTFARVFSIRDSVFSLRHLMAERDHSRIEVRLLSASTIPASSRVAALVDIAAGDPVVYLRRLVLSDATPAIYHREYVRSDPRRPLVELLAESASLHGLFGATQEEGFSHGMISLRAVALGRGAARILGEDTGAPALCIEHLFRDVTRRPVRWGRFLLRAELSKLHSWLGPDQPQLETSNHSQRRDQK